MLIPSKGNQVKFLNLNWGSLAVTQTTRDANSYPGKSSLFFLTVLNDPGIGLPGDRVEGLVEHSISGVSGASPLVLENPRGEIYFLAWSYS